MLNLSDIKFRKIFEDGGALRAIVSVTIDNCLAIHDIKVVQGNDRLFVAMPSRKDESGIFRDIVHPIDSAARNEFEAEILTAYENYIKVAEILDGED